MIVLGILCCHCEIICGLEGNLNIDSYANFGVSVCVDLFFFLFLFFCSSLLVVEISNNKSKKIFEKLQL